MEHFPNHLPSFTKKTSEALECEWGFCCSPFKAAYYNRNICKQTLQHFHMHFIWWKNRVCKSSSFVHKQYSTSWGFCALRKKQNKTRKCETFRQYERIEYYSIMPMKVIPIKIKLKWSDYFSAYRSLPRGSFIMATQKLENSKDRDKK